MKKIKEVNKVEHFKELSKREKQKISGGALAYCSAVMREFISIFIP
ncbi:hypothetical protein [Cellulosilyticum lentocellum]|uniref:Uncharacterized protein n=1 Tax=Cellulosilyticum lentocellum (strain ATCC 49066 / DSM 5427 / NCIMB 11756 / RHM5) TaxID=642492 RepID=F2JH07_CELLD|nr:hypothetical protein [Cellulosilyticum lentocellum]ADZ85347.1 hypothetical protein Clole_3664 [Cellulosilyticum lentocellum DSM 5427]